MLNFILQNKVSENSQGKTGTDILILPNKKKNVKDTVIKIVWFCFRNRQIDYWNTTESQWQTLIHMGV